MKVLYSVLATLFYPLWQISLGITTLPHRASCGKARRSQVNPLPLFFIFLYIIFLVICLLICVTDSPNETQILAILRNLTLVPQNDVEMASHTKCVEFLILSLSHPSPACVEDALETLAPLSYHLVLGWDGGESGEERGESRANSATLSVETSRIFVSKICSLLCEGYDSYLPLPFLC